MATASQTDTEYRGEPARRSPTLAFLLTMLCPGLGPAYLGHTLKGVLISLLFASAAGGFVALWTALKFFPALPFAVFVIGWVTLSLFIALDTAHEARRSGDRYILVPTNHPIVYVTIALVVYILPMLALGNFTTNRLWTFVWARGEAMYPTLVEGDLLLIDRTAYLRGPPGPGDVVLYQTGAGEADGLKVGRVIGLPQDAISVFDGVPHVNGEALPRAVLTGLTHKTDEGAMAALFEGVVSPPGIVSYTEVNRGFGYLTAESSNTMGTMFEPVILEPGEYYVLHDNRSWFGDSRELGPIGRGQILGEVVFVGFSRDDSGAARWERVARRLEPTPAPIAHAEAIDE